MGFRLRSRVSDRRRLAKILMILLIAALIYCNKHRVTSSSQIHEIASPSIAEELVAAISLGKRLAATDASQPQYAQALCREHNLNIFDRKPVPKPGTGSSKRKVFDLLTIESELDWLEVRLNSTYDFVDYFIIVEGRKSLTWQTKTLLVQENWARFSAYHKKIIYHEIEHLGATTPRQDIASLHRNAPFTQVFPHLKGTQSPTQGDVLLIADVEELVRPEALLVLRACETPRRLTLNSKLYSYSFEFLHRGVSWPHPQATTYQGLDDTLLPEDLRKGESGGVIADLWSALRRFFSPVVPWSPESGDLWNAGWHCAFCSATVDGVIDTRNRREGIGSQRRLQERSVGEDMFERIENNRDVPSALRADTERWAHLLDRTGSAGRFEDYYL